MNVMEKPDIDPHDLAYRLEYEGVDYALISYYPEIRCEKDKEAERLWDNARTALLNLRSYFKKHYGYGYDG